jgi:hypothetical protein
MHIYIDESGSFMIPKVKKPKVSCVTALIIPSSKNEKVLNEFIKIHSAWGFGSDEIKGSKLDEAKMAEVISFLRDYDVLIEICAIDIGSHSEKQVTDFKHTQADDIIKNFTPEHQSTMLEEANKYRQYLLDMPNQLFVQSFSMILLIDRLIETTTLYYCQRLPQELSEFHWIVDAKDIKVTKSEEWWNTLMLPMIETKSAKEPMMILEGGDYSYFDRFSKTLHAAPDHLRDDIEDPDAPYEAFDIKAVMQESFTFGDSKKYPGLQLVDIIASAFTRAMNQTVQANGWGNLGSLIAKRNPQSVRMIMLNTAPGLTGKAITSRNFQGYVLKKIEEKTKPMLLRLE